MIVNVFNGAIMLTIMELGPRNQVLELVGWGMGKIPESREGLELAAWGLVVAAGCVFLFARSAAFNALGLGDAVASSLGVSVHRLRIETFVAVAIVTSACVALAGPVGFVGLIVPHVCRMIFGPDHRKLAIVSAFAGAIFLMLADLLCRTVGPMLGGGELRVGVLTALCGGPFFVILLRRRSGRVAR